MKSRFMDFIICPDCKQELKLTVGETIHGEIQTGTIHCENCNIVYPIVRGIPRFFKDYQDEGDLRQVYADSFGHQWTTYNWLRDEDEFEFFQITDLSRDDFKGKTVFDAGCGGGRFVRFLGPLSGEIIGLDYSIAVEKAAELCRDFPNAHFIQCDINRHPFKPEIFDIVYSHGVLHHTPNTKKSFDKITPLVKLGGLLYMAVFRKAFILLRISDAFWRFVLNKLPIPVLDKICGGLSYLKYLPFAVFWKRFFWFSLQKTYEIRKCCLYDWYGPKYHHEHTVEEVQKWFTEAGFSKPKYINAWPYCPSEIKYKIPKFKDCFRLGQLLGMIGVRDRKTGSV